MKNIGLLIIGLALAAPLHAQDDVTADSFATGSQSPDAFAADAQSADAYASDTPSADAFSSDGAAGGDAPASGADAFASDAQSADAFASDAQTADSFSSDSVDANSFSSGAPDANSFSSDPSDANSFSSEPSDTNSFSSDANSFGDDSGGYDSTSTYGEEEAEDKPDPIPLYVGADYAWTTVSFSDPDLKAAFGGEQFDSNMIQLRAGVRLFKKIGLEAQYGLRDQDVGELDSDEFSTANYYGVYLVPTGVLLDLIEVGAAVGYSQTKLERGNASETLSGASFGVNFEVPLLTTERIDLRIGGGGTVYRAQNSARLYGYHAGIRMDFRI